MFILRWKNIQGATDTRPRFVQVPCKSRYNRGNIITVDIGVAAKASQELLSLKLIRHAK